MTLQMDGQMYRWTDGWTEGLGYNNIPTFSSKSAGIIMFGENLADNIELFFLFILEKGLTVHVTLIPVSECAKG